MRCLFPAAMVLAISTAVPVFGDVVPPKAGLRVPEGAPAVIQVAGADVGKDMVIGDPDRIAQVMGQMGMPATRGKDIEGMPMLESQVDGIRFNVYFYECAKVCERMQMMTGFQLSQPITAKEANDWNRDNPFSTVIAGDDGTAFIEMHIGLADDGVGRKNFERTLRSWQSTLHQFRDYIDW